MKGPFHSARMFSVALAMLAGCESPEQRVTLTHAYVAQTLRALRDCNEEYAKGFPANATLRAECQNRALNILRPRYPFPDLLDSFQAARMDIASRFGKKQISVNQASEQLLSRQREMAVEEHRRLAARSDGIDKAAIEAMPSVAIGQLVCETSSKGSVCF